MQWPNVTPGNYTLYVSVISAVRVRETSKSNNMAATAVNLATDQLLLPIVNK
jgi:hypothetical protein